MSGVGVTVVSALRLTGVKKDFIFTVGDEKAPVLDFIAFVLS